MKQYLDLIRIIRENGVFKNDRTGTGTYSIFGHQMRFDLAQGFPLVTTKKCHLRSIIHELLWFLQGDTNVRYLIANGVSIWDEWVKPETAEYRDLTKEEINLALNKHFSKPCDLVLNILEDEVDFKVASDYTEGDVERKLVYSYLPKEHFNPGSLQSGTLEELGWKDAYRRTFGKEPKVLVAGELGPVYGKQWREWEDVRIVEEYPTTEADMEKKGFESIGPITGVFTDNYNQMVAYRREIDQMAKIIDTLKNNPDSRRIIVSAWNPAFVDEMALPPCHALFQFYTSPISTSDIVKELTKRDLHDTFVRDMNEVFYAGAHYEWYSGNASQVLNTWVEHHLAAHQIPYRRLSCQLYQRSCDVGLGLPFNIASYALLTMMIAQVVNMAPGEFIWTGGDTHIYKNHVEKLDLQLTREPYPLPTMKINPEVKDIFGFQFSDFELVGYQAHPHISMPVAV